MKFRFAKKTDREDVLKFCTNTFAWGDYLDQVWDLWFTESDGALIVAEDESSDNNKRSAIAVSHISFCPNRKIIWLEGIRVNPDYRRRSIATELLNEMLSYGKRQGAKEASAIVAVNNIPSQLMMKKNGFSVISKWDYYSIVQTHEFGKVNARIANANDIEMVWQYLNKSHIYKSSGKRYVKSWRWYSFDRNTLSNIIKDEKLLIAGEDVIEGIAVINKCGYWNKSNIFEVVYLDALSFPSVYDLIGLVMMLVHSAYDRYQRIQIFSPQSKELSSVMKRLYVNNSEQFLLYKKMI